MDGPPYHGYTKKKNVLIGTSYLILASSMLISDDLVSVAFPPPCPSPPSSPTPSISLDLFIFIDFLLASRIFCTFLFGTNTWTNSRASAVFFFSEFTMFDSKFLFVFLLTIAASGFQFLNHAIPLMLRQKDVVSMSSVMAAARCNYFRFTEPAPHWEMKRKTKQQQRKRQKWRTVSLDLIKENERNCVQRSSRETVNLVALGRDWSKCCFFLFQNFKKEKNEAKSKVVIAAYRFNEQNTRETSSIFGWGGPNEFYRVLPGFQETRAEFLVVDRCSPSFFFRFLFKFISVIVVTSFTVIYWFLLLLAFFYGRIWGSFRFRLCFAGLYRVSWSVTEVYYFFLRGFERWPPRRLWTSSSTMWASRIHGISGRGRGRLEWNSELSPSTRIARVFIFIGGGKRKRPSRAKAGRPIIVDQRRPLIWWPSLITNHNYPLCLFIGVH